MNKTLTLALSGALLAGSGTLAHALLIDDFNGSAANIGTECNFGSTSADTGLGSHLGTRYIGCSGKSGTGLTALGLVDAGSAGGALGYSATAGKANSQVIWDAIGGADLTDLGVSDRFQFEVVFLDAGTDNFSYTLTVEDTSAATMVFTGTSLTNAGPVGGFPFDILFSAGVGPANLAAVAKITLDIVANENGVDYQIGNLKTTVPEPATLALLGLGLAGLGVGNRRRRTL